MTLRVRNLRGGFPRKDWILGPVNFTAHVNETVAIIGPNGAGKSTLMKLLLGNLDPESGTAHWQGMSLIECSEQERARKVSWLPQNPHVTFEYSVRRIVEMGTYVRGERADSGIVDLAMELTEVAELRNRTVGELSGGERRRVFLAKSLAQRPKLLLLDEPTAQLDIRFRWKLTEILNRVRDQLGSLMILWAQHNLEQSSRVADRWILLSNGDVIAQGDRNRVLTSRNLSRAYGTNVQVLGDSRTTELNVRPGN